MATKTSPPDHTAGVNSLPRWDPNNLDKGFIYDRSTYSRDREEYRKFKEARAARDKARQEKAERELDRVVKGANKLVADKVKEELKNSVQPGDVLTIDRPSTCFKSVSWQADESDDDGDEVNGVVTGEFHRGGDVVYSAPMTLSEFLDWADSESIGSAYNETKPF